MSEEIDKAHDKIWFVRRSGSDKIYGPMAAAKIRNYLLEARLELRDEVSSDRKQWRYLMEQPEVVPLQMRDPDKLSAQEYNDELDPGRKGSLWLPVLLVTVLVAGGISLAVINQSASEAVVTDCTASAASGVNWNSCNKLGLVAEDLQLDGLSAANADLERARLSGSSLQQANLQYARLDLAQLAYSNLSGANLKGASLRGADLSNAVLRDTDLRYADLSEARLGGAELQQAQLGGAIWFDGSRCRNGSRGECLPEQAR